MIEEEHLRNAVKRIALTGDGRILHVYLQRKLMEVCPNPGVAGALPLFEGERRFASELKALMDSALSEQPSDGPAGPTTERPIVVARPSGLSIAGSGGARRRVPITPE